MGQYVGARAPIVWYHLPCLVMFLKHRVLCCMVPCFLYGSALRTRFVAVTHLRSGIMHPICAEPVYRRVIGPALFIYGTWPCMSEPLASWLCRSYTGSAFVWFACHSKRFDIV